MWTGPGAAGTGSALTWCPKSRSSTARDTRCSWTCPCRPGWSARRSKRSRCARRWRCGWLARLPPRRHPSQPSSNPRSGAAARTCSWWPAGGPSRTPTPTKSGSPSCPTSAVRSPARSTSPYARYAVAQAARARALHEKRRADHDALGVVVQENRDTPGDQPARDHVHGQIAVQDEEEIYQVGVIRNERPTIADGIGPPTYPNQPAVLAERRGPDLNSLDAVRHGHQEVIES